MKKQEVLEKSQHYGLDISGEGFIAAVLGIDFNTAQASLPIWEDRELMKFAVLNISEEIINKYSFNISFFDDDRIVIIFNSSQGHRDLLMGKALSILEEIRQSIEKYLRFTVTIGVGTFCSDIINISHSYENAVAALDYRLVHSSNRIICIEDVEPRCSVSTVFDELRGRALASCIKVGTAEEISETIEGLFKEIIDMRATFKDYQIYLLELLTTILKVARDLDVDMDHLFGINHNLFADMYKFQDLNRVKEWIIGICTKVKSYISKERQDTCKLLVKKAKEYLQSHYHENDITIDKVCKYLHISSTYFSAIFKKETKLTFINYLTHIRMEAARELLRTTDMKAFEIAERLGYSEPNYFSYSFKKNFGISPTEYRNSF